VNVSLADVTGLPDASVHTAGSPGAGPTVEDSKTDEAALWGAVESAPQAAMSSSAVLNIAMVLVGRTGLMFALS
jgi:hypothetical protein